MPQNMFIFYAYLDIPNNSEPSEHILRTFSCCLKITSNMIYTCST